jgi:hypothetical protein
LLTQRRFGNSNIVSFTSMWRGFFATRLPSEARFTARR